MPLRLSILFPISGPASTVAGAPGADPVAKGRGRGPSSATVRLLVPLALVLTLDRLAAAVVLRHSFFVSGFTAYDTVAENLLHGRGFTYAGHPFAEFPLLYPLLAAAAFAVGGHAWWPIAVMQTLFDLASLGFLFLLGRRLLGVAPAVVGCLFFAVYPPLASQSAQLLVTSPFTLALLAFLYLAVRLADRPSSRSGLVAGAVAGVGYQLRVEMLVVVLLLPAILALLHLGRRDIGRVSAAVGVAFVLVLAPMVVRNAIVFHRFAPAPAEGGITLWEGNSPHSAEFVGAGKSGDLLFALPDAPQPPASAGPYQIDDFWYRHSLDWIRSHPGGFLHGLRVKFVALWSWNLNPLTGGDSRWKQLVYTASYAPTLVLALVGLAMGLIRSLRRETLVLALVLVALGIVHVVVQAFTRMRLPSDPLLMLLAGLALYEAGKVVARRRLGAMSGDAI